MKKSQIAITFMLLIASLLTAYSVRAGIGDIVLWPVITNINSVPNGTTNKIVSFTVDMIPLRQTNTRLTLSGHLVLAASGANQKGYIFGPDLLSGNSVGLTWQQASDQWLAKYGRRTVLVQNLELNYTGGCGGISVGQNNTNSPNGTWNGVLDTPTGLSSCTVIPISDYRCIVTPESLNIDYGRVNSVEANGKVASVDFNMACDGPVTFTFASSSGATLALDTKLSAQLTIDGQSLGTKLTIPAGNSAHILSAKLSANNVTAGTYSQSTALIINYQ